MILPAAGRLAGIRIMETANVFLPAFVQTYNTRFAKPPRRGIGTCIGRWRAQRSRRHPVLARTALRLATAGRAFRKLDPGILVMQSAQDWVTKNVPGAIDGARD